MNLSYLVMWHDALCALAHFSKTRIPQSAVRRLIAQCHKTELTQKARRTVYVNRQHRRSHCLRKSDADISLPIVTGEIKNKTY